MIRKLLNLLNRTGRVTSEANSEHAEVLATIKFPCC